MKTQTTQNNISFISTVAPTRNKAVRHDGTYHDVLLAGKPYQIEDWSMDGVLFETPDYDWNVGGVYFEAAPSIHLQAGDMVSLTLQFHVFDETINIPVQARITRVDTKGTAAKFGTLSPQTRHEFDRVIDLLNARDFLQSQTSNKKQSYNA